MHRLNLSNWNTGGRTVYFPKDDQIGTKMQKFQTVYRMKATLLQVNQQRVRLIENALYSM